MRRSPNSLIMIIFILPQVFHICQQGGRRDSFLCPNGTMFNQQLFVCDWWHNVQCDEVASFYALNEHIHDQWESKRTSKECNDKAAAASAAVPETNRVRRMGDLKGRHWLGN